MDEYIGYIYKTTNLINGKIYIGKHQRSEFDKRYYGSGIIIQKALNKYGKDNFKVEVINWYKSVEDLNDAEIRFIEAYQSRDLEIGYNLSQGGKLGNTGIKMSDEQREKLKKALTGRPLSEETKRKISKALKGRISGMKGKKQSEEAKKKISNASKSRPGPWKGKTMDEETRKKMSMASKGKPKSKEHAKHIGEGHKGKVITEETKKKMSDAKIGYIPWNKGLKNTISEENRKKINEAHERKRLAKMLANKSLEENLITMPELHKEAVNEC